MQVIAINEYKEDFPVGVAKIKEGDTADHTMFKWLKKHSYTKTNQTEEQALEDCLFCWQELEMENL